MSTRHRPSYHLRIGSLRLSPATFSGLLALELRVGKQGLVGEALVTLAAGHDEALAMAKAMGDPVELDLGWGDELQRVFTGRVCAVEPRYGFAAPRLLITAFDPLMRLVQAPRRPRLFENQTPGAIVKALAADAGVVAGRVDEGLRIARSMLHRESAFTHCCQLAELAGFDFYADAQGKLEFVRFARRAADEVLQFGVDLLNVRRRQVAAPAGLTVVPESPASSAGDEAAAWLVKDPKAHAATAGAGDTLTLSKPVLRTRDGAQQAAKAWLGQRWRSGSTTAQTSGRASLRLGQAIELRNVPQAGLDGLYELLALQHRYDVTRGFSSTLSLARMD